MIIFLILCIQSERDADVRTFPLFNILSSLKERRPGVNENMPLLLAQL